MKKANIDSVSKFFISIIGLVVLAIVLKELQHILVPLVIATLLYFLFEPINKFFKKRKIPEDLAILTNIIIIFFAIWAFFRVIIDSFEKFQSALPAYGSKLNGMLKEALFSLGISKTDLANFDLMSIAREINISGIAENFFSSTISIVSTTFFVILFYVFLSKGYQNIYQAIQTYYVNKNINLALKKFKSAKKKEGEEISRKEISQEKNKLKIVVKKTFDDITEQVQKYIVTKTFISLTTSLASGIVLYLFDIDFILVWIVITFFFNFIPNIGSIFSVLFPTLIALVQFESIGYTLLMALILTGTQNIIGNFLEPKILGNRLGLNPLIILLFLLLWGYIWGIVGMFLAVPLTAAIKIILSNSETDNLKFISSIMDN